MHDLSNVKEPSVMDGKGSEKGELWVMDERRHK